MTSAVKRLVNSEESGMISWAFSGKGGEKYGMREKVAIYITHDTQAYHGNLPPKGGKELWQGKREEQRRSFY
jgi:hypothetical protein